MESTSTMAADQAKSMMQPDLPVGDLVRLIEAKRAEQAPLPETARSLTPELLTERIARIPALTEEEAQRRNGERAAFDERERQYRSRERWASLIRDRGSRYATCRLSNFETTCEAQRAALQRVKEYAGNIVKSIAEGVNVILIGPAGTGKDHLLIGLCHAAITACRSVEWCNGTSLWLKFRHAIGDERGDESRIVRELVSPDVLAISDPIPPRGTLSEYQAAMLFDIVDARYSDRKPVWLTLNCANREEAEERLTVQVVDRLAHGAVIIACNWPSYRSKERASA